jgi:hypothetical protein
MMDDDATQAGEAAADDEAEGRESWSDDDTTAFEDIAKQQLLPAFLAAVADAMLRVDGPFIDSRRFQVGAALLMSMTRLLIQHWAERFDIQHTSGSAYETVASRVLEDFPKWLGMAKASEAFPGEEAFLGEGTPDDLLDVAKTLYPELKKLVARIDASVATVCDGPPRGGLTNSKEIVALALISGAAGFMARRYEVRGSDRQHRWLGAFALACGVEVIEPDPTA